MKWLLILGLVGSAFAQPSIPLPRIVTARVTNGTVMLGWAPGYPVINGVSNVTTRVNLAYGLFDHYLASDLPMGSTNVFVAYNDSGLSNMATGVARPFQLKATIQPYVYMVTVPTSTNGITQILTSTDLKAWNSFITVTNSGPTYQFAWTNDGLLRFFHSVSP